MYVLDTNTLIYFFGTPVDGAPSTCWNQGACWNDE